MPAAVSPQISYVEMTEMVLPHHMNPLGTVFGGVIMSWVDIAGTISAARYCSKTVVTASIDDVHFLAPVHKGDFVCLFAQVNYVHKTSMEVSVDVFVQNVLKNIKSKTAGAYLTFVALDENHKPTPVPPLDLKTPAEKELFRQAEQRRKWRLERRKQFKLKNS